MAEHTWYKGIASEDDQETNTSKNRFQKDKEKGRNISASTVMFIPSTKDGKLLKLMREREPNLVEMTGFRINYTESGGTQLARIFSTNLSVDQPCGRETSKCRPCNSQWPKLQNCKAKNILYESSCELCNPEESQMKATIVEKGKESDQKEGREGIYLGETSRSLAERCGEHFRDAESFNKKSHVIKHWMSSHEEADSPPPFRFRIVKQYKDCLSRQVGEAIAILLSKDKLLNSKNEYLQNCITRITVQEDIYERKTRIIREEEEEKQDEERIKAFRAKKRPSKRKNETDKTDQFHQSKRPRLTINQEEGKTSSYKKEGFGEEGYKEVATNLPVKEVAKSEESKKDGKTKLLDLRRRMASEKRWIINYFNNRRMEEALPEIRHLWNSEGQARRNMNKKSNKTIEGLEKKLDPDKILIGWRGWWTRMWLEARRDQAKTNIKIKTKPIQSYFTRVISKEDQDQAEEGHFGLRRFSSSSRSLENAISKPQVPDVQDFSKHYGPDQAEQIVVEVVTQRDSPGKMKVPVKWINSSGGEGNLETDK